MLFRGGLYRDMGTYTRGDVVLAAVPFNGYDGVKNRPAVVMAARENGDLMVCPVSSRAPSDAPCVPIVLDDFCEGGLDLFSESFALTARVTVISNRAVIAKKGRLMDEITGAICLQAHETNETSLQKAPHRNRRYRR